MLPILARKAIGAGGKIMARKIMGRKEKVSANQQKPQASNAIVKAEKFVGDSVKPVSALIKPPEPLKQTSSGTVSKDSPLKVIRIKVLEIESILVGTLAAEKAALKAEKAEFKNKNRQEQEEELEKKDLNPKRKMKIPKVPGTGGIFGWIKNFIGNILMGLFLMKLVDNVGMLEGLMKLIKGVSNFIADVGIKLIDAFATFIDWGYKAYDATKGFLENFGVSPELFDKFAGAISGLIDALIIASVILAERGEDGFDRRRPGGRGRGGRRKPGFRIPGTGPGVTKGRGGKKPGFRIPGTGPKVTGGKKPGFRIPGTGPKVTGGRGGKLPKVGGLGRLFRFLRPLGRLLGPFGFVIDFLSIFGGSGKDGPLKVGVGSKKGPKLPKLPGTGPKVTGAQPKGPKLPKLPGTGPKVTGSSPKVTGTKPSSPKVPKVTGSQPSSPKVPGTKPGGLQLPKALRNIKLPTGLKTPKSLKGGGLLGLLLLIPSLFEVGGLFSQGYNKTAINIIISTIAGLGAGSLASSAVIAGAAALGLTGVGIGAAIALAASSLVAGGVAGWAAYEGSYRGLKALGLRDDALKSQGYQGGGEVNDTRKKNKRKNKITRTIGGSRKKPTIKRLIKKPSIENLANLPEPTSEYDSESTLLSKQRSWWDFLGWAGTGENQTIGKAAEYLAGKVTVTGNTLGKNDYFGPLLRVTSKVILNQDITPRDTKNVGLAINYLLNTGLEKKEITTAVKAYAKGGVVDNTLGLDVVSWVEDTFNKTVKTNVGDIDIVSARKTKFKTDSKQPTPGTEDVFEPSTPETDPSAESKPTPETPSAPSESTPISSGASNAVFGTTAQRRLLDTISWAEGTGGGYGVVYGGGISPELAEGKMTISQVLKFMETSPLYKRDGYNSDATGRYQFMSYVLKEEAEKQGIPFDTLWTPELQDRMILNRLATVRGVTAEMIEKEGMSDNVIDRLAPEFASFPNLIGPDSQGRVGTNTSYYGQGGKSADSIKKYYGETTGEGTAIKLQEPSSPSSAASPESLRPVEPSSQTQPSGRVSPSEQNQSGKTPTPSASSQSSDSKDKSKGKSKEKLSGEEIAGKLGDFMKANRSDIGVTGSIHQWLPRHSPKFTRGYASYHNENRALDIGGWSPSSPEGGGADEQAPVIAALLKWNKENGFNPVELIHGSPAFKGVGSYRKYPDSHHHHVHVAYEKGGMTLDGPHLAMLGEKGKEIVIDNDSSVAEVTPMLLAINAAKDKQGVMEAIRAYAPYDSRSEKVVIIDDSDDSSYDYEEMEPRGSRPTSRDSSGFMPPSYDNSLDFLDYQG